MPTNKADYPPDWPAIARAVKEAAGWKCQRCGAPHLKIIRRDERHDGAGWTVVLKVYNETSINFKGGKPGAWESTSGMNWSRLKFHGLTKVILSTAHLDRDTTNNAPENLEALCQRCHLLHDKHQHADNRRYGRRHSKAHQRKMPL